MKVYGNTTGLKSNQIKRLENLYRRKIPTDRIVNPEFARALTEMSLEIKRQIGAIIDRRGAVQFVVVGDHAMIVIPDLSRHRAGGTRFRGLRLIHTHLKGEPLSRDDLTDLVLLRFDLVAAVGVEADGLPGDVFVAHLLPENGDGDVWTEWEPESIHDLDEDFDELISSLEEEFARTFRARKVKKGEGAILIGCYADSYANPEDSMAELKELCVTSGLSVVDTVMQKRSKIDPKWVLGQGKLKNVVIRAMQRDADLLVFDGELKPAQVDSITDFTELKVIDRTQVILDIFARRAKSRQGKIQVELAQLNYMLPRLVKKNTAMSRLTGGIGGRGPGETKLEINRRRVRDRINRLEKEIHGLERERGQQRALRVRKELPIISIIGYTNAGKSTLLNTLTKSNVDARNMLFATLDPSSRRLRFPREIEVIVTDTVGFIRDLPKELMAAFSATLDELKIADLLLHVVDVSDPLFLDRIGAVNEILKELDLLDILLLLAFNKMDKIDITEAKSRAEKHDAVLISAVDNKTLAPLISRLEEEMTLVIERERNEDTIPLETSLIGEA
ncbi:MAG: GTPase HflX [Deltaproteobacteria bacterium]|nr:GTPase HflX [Candidatus Zymogenaceae bacterium]